MNWPTTNLGDLAKIKTGKLDANASSDDGKYPFFTCAREPLRISSFTYDCECVLVAGNGDLNVKYYEGKFDAYQRTYIVEALPESKDDLHLRYVYHFLETYLETLREQSIGGIIKYIKLGNLTEAKIPLPPLAEQKRIAEILDAADALRAKRRESLAQLDILLQSVFLDMFGDPVSNPKGWDAYPLSDVCATTQGVQIPRSAQIEELREGYERYLYINDFYSDESPKYIEGIYDKKRVTNDDLVVANTGSPGRVFKGRPGILSNNLFRVSFDTEKIITLFFFYFLSSDNFQMHLQAQMKHGIQRHLGHKTFGRQSLYVPPIALQRIFEEIAQAITRQKQRLEGQLDELDTLFASLQFRAFRGEL